MGHQIRGRLQGLPHGKHATVDRLRGFLPQLGGGLPTLSQVLVDNPRSTQRVLLQLLVLLPALGVSQQGRLDLHIGEQVTGTQGLFQSLEHGLGLRRIGFLADLRLGLGHLRGLGRVDGPDIAHGQGKARLQARHTLLDTGVQRRLIINAGIFVSLDRLTGTDFLDPVLQLTGGLISTARGVHLHLQHRAQLAHRIHAGEPLPARALEQRREQARHVGGLEIARLPLQGDGLQGLLHDLGIADPGLQLKGPHQVRRIFDTRALPHREPGRKPRVTLRLVQRHALGSHLPHQSRHLVAGHSRIP